MSVLEAKRTTLADMEVLMTAQGMRAVDMRFESAIYAWDNLRIQQTKKKGKKTIPLYASFQDFFDYEKELERLKGEEAIESTAKDTRLGVLRKIKDLNKGGE